MNTNTAFAELKKAQDILLEAIEKSAKTHLDSVQKLMDLNKQGLSGLTDLSNPGELIARQSATFKEYAEQVSAHMEALSAIGAESREQLMELGQEFAKGLDFSSLFGLGDAPAKGKPRAAKAA